MGLRKSAELLVKSKEALVKLKGELTGSHEKIASLQAEQELLVGVLGLVQEGQIDPNDILTKLAEFKEDPTKLLFMQQATNMGLQKQAFTLGQVTELGPGSDELPTGSSEEKFAARVKNLFNS